MYKGGQVYRMTPGSRRHEAGEMEAASIQHAVLVRRQALGNITALAIV